LGGSIVLRRVAQLIAFSTWPRSAGGDGAEISQTSQRFEVKIEEKNPH
jgi:hypothetical protein